jgi:hypothetical protein
MRFYLFYPARRTPGGGHKQMRILARNLRLLGHESYLVVEGDAFDDNVFYDIHLPAAGFTLSEAADLLDAADVLILPEFELDRTLALTSGTRCRKAVYAQGGFLALLYRPKRGYARNGIAFMIGVSPYIAALGDTYLRAGRGHSFYVPYPVVRGPFAKPPRPFADKQLAVCYMPRKLPEHIHAVREIVTRRHPTVPWVPIDGMPETEVARMLDANAIFFSTQNGEGYGLPAAEAMARGCIVTGYRGTGLFPHPYATAANGLWARDRSIRRAATKVNQAIAMAREAGPPLTSLLAAARHTLLDFTEEKAMEALASAISAIKEGFPTTFRPTYRLGLLGHLQAWRTLQVAGRIRPDRLRPAASLGSVPHDTA